MTENSSADTMDNCRGVQRPVYELGESVLFLLLLLPEEETLAQGSSMRSFWAAEHRMARLPLEHLQE